MAEGDAEPLEPPTHEEMANWYSMSWLQGEILPLRSQLVEAERDYEDLMESATAYRSRMNAAESRAVEAERRYEEANDALWECARQSGADLEGDHWRVLKHPGVGEFAIEHIRDLAQVYNEALDAIAAAESRAVEAERRLKKAEDLEEIRLKSRRRLYRKLVAAESEVASLSLVVEAAKEMVRTVQVELSTEGEPGQSKCPDYPDEPCFTCIADATDDLIDALTSTDETKEHANEQNDRL